MDSREAGAAHLVHDCRKLGLKVEPGPKPDTGKGFLTQGAGVQI